MKKRNRLLLIKTLLGELFTIISIVFLILDLNAYFVFIVILFGFAGVCTLIIPTEVFEKIILIFKS